MKNSCFFYSCAFILLIYFYLTLYNGIPFWYYINLILIVILVITKATISQPTTSIFTALGVLYLLSICAYLTNTIKQVAFFLFYKSENKASEIESLARDNLIILYYEINQFFQMLNFICSSFFTTICKTEVIFTYWVIFFSSFTFP